MESNPVFVKLDKYKDIVELIEVIDKKILGVKQILTDLEELKKQENEELSNWEKSVDEITHKMANLKEELAGD